MVRLATVSTCKIYRVKDQRDISPFDFGGVSTERSTKERVGREPRLKWMLPAATRRAIMRRIRQRFKTRNPRNPLDTGPSRGWYGALERVALESISGGVDKERVDRAPTLSTWRCITIDLRAERFKSMQRRRG